jgi:hypothetical protein
MASREAAFRSFNWVTYFQGLPGGAHAPFGGNQWWFTDEFADGPRRLMDAFWAVPEWAPVDESHLLGSSSVVTRIEYGKGSVTYSTFDAGSVDVLRLNFLPQSVTANGVQLKERKVLDQPGFVLDASTRVLRIRHDGARNVEIQGNGGTRVSTFVTFDDPHLAAESELGGLYPAGLIEWPQHQWKIGTPAGKFGTFNLKPADASAQELDFVFPAPRIFMGVDVYNDGPSEASVAIHSAGADAVLFKLEPGELRRVRTGWAETSSKVTFKMTAGSGLRFDNLAYASK